MTAVSVIGAGAFGTALAIALAQDGRQVTLVTRSPKQAGAIRSAGENRARLPGVGLPGGLRITHETAALAETCLLAVPTQALGAVIARHAADFAGRSIVACCKGVDLASGRGPTGIISAACPACRAAILSGPGFAQDISGGLPTAMTLAASDERQAETLQALLSTKTLRLYRSTDTVGVELGGALKNVVALAAGVAIGAGLGESARAAIITRGYAEMVRFAVHAGAREETLAGLSGLGDLVLTCTSDKSRNFRHGLALGRAEPPDAELTVEGVATARAVAELARERQIDMPLTTVVAALVEGKITTRQAVETLLSRPLKKE